MKAKYPLIILAVLTLMYVTSCKVMLIGAYDEVTDQSIQKIQTDVSGLLITLKKNLINNNPSANAYTNFDKTYNTIEAEVSSLDTRCKALPKYTIIISQISLLNKSVSDLEQLHKFPNAFSRMSDTSQINSDLSTMNVAFTAMVSLQNGLKATKN